LFIPIYALACCLLVLASFLPANIPQIEYLDNARVLVLFLVLPILFLRVVRSTFLHYLSKAAVLLFLYSTLAKIPFYIYLQASDPDNSNKKHSSCEFVFSKSSANLNNTRLDKVSLVAGFEKQDSIELSNLQTSFGNTLSITNQEGLTTFIVSRFPLERLDVDLGEGLPSYLEIIVNASSETSKSEQSKLFKIFLLAPFSPDSRDAIRKNYLYWRRIATRIRHEKLPVVVYVSANTTIFSKAYQRFVHGSRLTATSLGIFSFTDPTNFLQFADTNHLLVSENFNWIKQEQSSGNSELVSLEVADCAN